MKTPNNRDAQQRVAKLNSTAPYLREHKPLRYDLQFSFARRWDGASARVIYQMRDARSGRSVSDQFGVLDFGTDIGRVNMARRLAKLRREVKWQIGEKNWRES